MWTDSLEKTLMLERLKVGGEGDNRGWDVWMVSLTWWTWIWVGLGVGDGQRSLACCNPWGRKESDTNEQLNWTELNIPKQTLTCFLSLQVNLHFLGVYVNKIIQYMSPFLRIISLRTITLMFIHVVACINISFLLITKHQSILWTHQNLFLPVHIDRLLGWFHIWPSTNKDAINICKEVFLWTYTFISLG